MNLDMEKLVDSVTKMIMERLESAGQSAPCSAPDRGAVAVFGEVPQGMIQGDYAIRQGGNCGDIGDCGYVLMTAERFRALRGDAACPPAAAACPAGEGRVVDLSAKRLLHERDLRENNAQGGTVVLVGKKTIITALAHDYARSIGVKIQKG